MSDVTEGSPLTLHVRGYKRVRAADLDFDRNVVAISAPNARGKTSICEAARAVLLQDPLVADTGADDVTKKDAEILVHEGYGDRAYAALVHPGGQVAIEWPKCDIVMRGENNPWSGPTAAGLAAFMPPMVERKKRPGLFVDMLRAEVTKDMVKDAVQKAGFKTAKGPDGNPREPWVPVWDLIQAKGWDGRDGAAQTAIDQRVHWRNQWQEATGEAYGSTKAVNWRPKDWHPSWDGNYDAAEAKEDAAKALAEYEAAVAKAKELEGWADYAKNLSVYEKDLVERQRLVDAAERNVKFAEGLAATPNKNRKARAICECPHCGGAIEVHEKEGAITLEAPPEERQEEGEKKTVITLREAKAAHEQAVANKAAAQDRVDTAKRLQGQATQADLDKAYLTRSSADDRCKERRAKWTMIDQVERAARAHIQHQRWDSLAGALQENGLRRTALMEKLKPFSDLLRDIGVSLGLPTLEIDQDFRITIGGKVFGLASGTERFVTRVAFQIAAAKTDGSWMIVIDWDESSLQSWYHRVLTTLWKYEVRALVSFVVPKVEVAMPSGPKARSYWLNSDGSAKLITPGATTEKPAAA